MKTFLLVWLYALGVALIIINILALTVHRAMIEQSSAEAFIKPNNDVYCLEWKTPISCKYWVSREQYHMVIDHYFNQLKSESNDRK